MSKKHLFQIILTYFLHHIIKKKYFFEYGHVIYNFIGNLILRSLVKTNLKNVIVFKSSKTAK